MPLQSTGAISLEQVRNEFKSGSGSISFNELYRGGSYVPNDSFCHNNTIPSSGQISINGFYATTKGSLYYDNQNVSTLPLNAVRFQIFEVGGGGGSSYINASGNILYRYAASGGGGGYSTYTVSNVTRGVHSITVSVGSGGALLGAYYGTTNQNPGTQSVVNLLNNGNLQATYTAPPGTGGQAYNAGYPAGGGGVPGEGGVGNTGTGGNGTGAKNNTNTQPGGAGGWPGVSQGKGGDAHATVAASRQAGSGGLVRLRF